MQPSGSGKLWGGRFSADLSDLPWQSSSVVAQSTSKPLSVAQVGSIFYVSFPNPENMPVYMWGDVSEKEQVLEFARRLTELAVLGPTQ